MAPPGVNEIVAPSACLSDSDGAIDCIGITAFSDYGRPSVCQLHVWSFNRSSSNTHLSKILSRRSKNTVTAMQALWPLISCHEPCCRPHDNNLLGLMSIVVTANSRRRITVNPCYSYSQSYWCIGMIGYWQWHHTVAVRLSVCLWRCVFWLHDTSFRYMYINLFGLIEWLT